MMIYVAMHVYYDCHAVYMGAAIVLEFVDALDGITTVAGKTVLVPAR